jgi:hypothetical protein
MAEVYIVMKNSDMEEGRGPMLIDCVFSSLVEATAWAEGRYDYYGFGAVRQGWANIRTEHVFESVQEASDRSTRRLRQQALAKLSEAERKALGV